MTHDQRLALQAVASGVLSYAAVPLVERLFPGSDMGRIWPGLIFGVLVLAPEVGPGLRRNFRRALLIVLSILIYSSMVRLAVHEITEFHWRDMPACALSGFLGAVLMGLTARFILPRDIGPRQLTAAALAGAVAGSLFGLKGTFGIPSDLEVCTMVVGFVAWQTGAAWTLLREPAGSRP